MGRGHSDGSNRVGIGSKPRSVSTGSDEWSWSESSRVKTRKTIQNRNCSKVLLWHITISQRRVANCLVPSVQAPSVVVSSPDCQSWHWVWEKNILPVVVYSPLFMGKSPEACPFLRKGSFSFFLAEGVYFNTLGQYSSFCSQAQIIAFNLLKSNSTHLFMKMPYATLT